MRDVKNRVPGGPRHPSTRVAHTDAPGSPANDGDLPEFSRRLKRLREARGYSQSDLARRASLNSSYLSRLERGVDKYRSPRISTVRQLIEALGLSSAEGRALYELVHPGEPSQILSPPERATYYEYGRERVNQFDPGEGYILIRVDRPSHSRDIAFRLAQKFPDEVRCAAAVFGRYDVVAWVRSTNYRSLVHIIDSLHTAKEFASVRYTQTILVRWDEAYLEARSEYNGMERMAFVFLRKHKGTATDLMKNLTPISVDNAEILHAATITGAYDAALTLRYVNSASLEQLIVELQNLQYPSLSECVAVPCLSNMIFLGKGLQWLDEPRRKRNTIA